MHSFGRLVSLPQFAGDASNHEEEQESQSDMLIAFSPPELDDISVADSQALAYVSGWVLKPINLLNCDNCKNILYSQGITRRHFLTMRKEIDDIQRLRYASDFVMNFVQKIHHCLYQFLDKRGFEQNLERSFKYQFKQNVELEQNCIEHNCAELILDKCTRFLILKFCRDKEKFSTISSGHRRKIRRLV